MYDDASAVAIEAEYTITSPVASRSSVAHASDASQVSIARGSRGSAPSPAVARGAANGRSMPVDVIALRMRALRRPRANQRREAIPALDVVRELVEARAGGR